MANEFEMSMIRELSYFLGHQIKYIKDKLRKFRTNDIKAISTPMGTNENLDSDASDNMVDQKLYHSMIGNLLYVTASSPDVIFSVCMCARFQASPREGHFKVIKRILRYLKHTQNIGLWYPKGQSLSLLDIRTLTMQNARLKGRALWALVNCWEDHLFHGHQRRKIVLHYQSPTPNTYPPVVVVYKFFG
jgi:hypothetical protein